MGVIGISVRNKIATNTTPDEIIVCGNSDYSVEFDFDAEWSASASKIARFVYFIGNNRYFKDSEPFKGNTVSVPVLSNIDQVLVGVYTADMSTTTPARVLCSRSIRCGGAVEHITPAEKAGLQAQIGDLEGLETSDKSSLVDAVNEVYRLSGGELDPEIVERAVQDYLTENPIESGVNFTTDETLSLDPDTKVLRVNTAHSAEQDNTLPITSAAVHTQIGNIEVLLQTI